jgi:hypothetical protein
VSRTRTRRALKRRQRATEFKKCPTPAKLCYSTKASAEDALRHNPFDGDRRVRAYECRCGKWHLTSRSGNENGERTPLKTKTYDNTGGATG